MLWLLLPAAPVLLLLLSWPSAVAVFASQAIVLWAALRFGVARAANAALASRIIPATGKVGSAYVGLRRYALQDIRVKLDADVEVHVAAATIHFHWISWFLGFFQARLVSLTFDGVHITATERAVLSPGPQPCGQDDGNQTGPPAPGPASDKGSPSASAPASAADPNSLPPIPLLAFLLRGTELLVLRVRIDIVRSAARLVLTNQRFRFYSEASRRRNQAMIHLVWSQWRAFVLDPGVRADDATDREPLLALHPCALTFDMPLTLRRVYSFKLHCQGLDVSLDADSIPIALRLVHNASMPSTSPGGTSATVGHQHDREDVASRPAAAHSAPAASSAFVTHDAARTRRMRQLLAQLPTLIELGIDSARVSVARGAVSADHSESDVASLVLSKFKVMASLSGSKRAEYTSIEVSCGVEGPLLMCRDAAWPNASQVLRCHHTSVQATLLGQGRDADLPAAADAGPSLPVFNSGSVQLLMESVSANLAPRLLHPWMSFAEQVARMSKELDTVRRSTAGATSSRSGAAVSSPSPPISVASPAAAALAVHNSPLAPLLSSLQLEFPLVVTCQVSDVFVNLFGSQDQALSRLVVDKMMLRAEEELTPAFVTSSASGQLSPQSMFSGIAATSDPGIVDTASTLSSTDPSVRTDRGGGGGDDDDDDDDVDQTEDERDALAHADLQAESQDQVLLLGSTDALFAASGAPRAVSVDRRGQQLLADPHSVDALASAATAAAATTDEQSAEADAAPLHLVNQWKLTLQIGGLHADLLHSSAQAAHERVPHLLAVQCNANKRVLGRFLSLDVFSVYTDYAPGLRSHQVDVDLSGLVVELSQELLVTSQLLLLAAPDTDESAAPSSPPFPTSLSSSSFSSKAPADAVLMPKVKAQLQHVKVFLVDTLATSMHHHLFMAEADLLRASYQPLRHSVASGSAAGSAPRLHARARISVSRMSAWHIDRQAGGKSNNSSRRSSATVAAPLGSTGSRRSSRSRSSIGDSLARRRAAPSLATRPFLHLPLVALETALPVHEPRIEVHGVDLRWTTSLQVGLFALVAEMMHAYAEHQEQHRLDPAPGASSSDDDDDIADGASDHVRDKHRVGAVAAHRAGNCAAPSLPQATAGSGEDAAATSKGSPSIVDPSASTSTLPHVSVRRVRLTLQFAEDACVDVRVSILTVGVPCRDAGTTAVRVPAPSCSPASALRPVRHASRLSRSGSSASLASMTTVRGPARNMSTDPPCVPTRVPVADPLDDGCDANAAGDADINSSVGGTSTTSTARGVLVLPAEAIVISDASVSLNSHRVLAWNECVVLAGDPARSIWSRDLHHFNIDYDSVAGSRDHSSNRSGASDSKAHAHADGSTLGGIGSANVPREPSFHVPAHTLADVQDALPVIVDMDQLVFTLEHGFAFGEALDRVLVVVKAIEAGAKDHVSAFRKRHPLYLAPEDQAKARTKVSMHVRLANSRMDLLDDPFQRALTDIWRLRIDEFEQAETRRRLLEQRFKDYVASQRPPLTPEQEGALWSEKLALLQQRDASVYIRRARKMMQQRGARTAAACIATVSWKSAHLTLVDGDQMHGKRLLDLVARLDSASSQPAFDRSILGRDVYLRFRQLSLQLRDYPTPFVTARSVQLAGPVVFAEFDARAHALLRQNVSLSRVYTIAVDRTLTPVKVYLDAVAQVDTLSVTHGQCLEPALSSMGDAFARLSSDSSDPSPPLPWWDKMRFQLHGPIRVFACDATIKELMSKRDPYRQSEYMEIKAPLLCLSLGTGRADIAAVRFTVLQIPRRPHAAYIIDTPLLRVGIAFRWICSGPCNEHYVIPTVPAIPKHLAKRLVAVHGRHHGFDRDVDSYAAFRSSALHLDIDAGLHPALVQGVTLLPTVTIDSDSGPWLHRLYRQFEQAGLSYVFKMVDRSKPAQPRVSFGKHMRRLDLHVDLEHPLIWAWNGRDGDQSGLHLDVDSIALSMLLVQVLSQEPTPFGWARRIWAWQVAESYADAYQIQSFMSTPESALAAYPSREQFAAADLYYNDSEYRGDYFFSAPLVSYRQQETLDADSLAPRTAAGARASTRPAADATTAAATKETTHASQSRQLRPSASAGASQAATSRAAGAPVPIGASTAAARLSLSSLSSVSSELPAPRAPQCRGAHRYRPSPRAPRLCLDPDPEQLAEFAGPANAPAKDARRRLSEGIGRKVNATLSTAKSVLSMKSTPSTSTNASSSSAGARGSGDVLDDAASVSSASSGGSSVHSALGASAWSHEDRSSGSSAVSSAGDDVAADFHSRFTVHDIRLHWTMPIRNAVYHWIDVYFAWKARAIDEHNERLVMRDERLRRLTTSLVGDPIAAAAAAAAQPASALARSASVPAQLLADRERRRDQHTGSQAAATAVAADTKLLAALDSQASRERSVATADAMTVQLGAAGAEIGVAHAPVGSSVPDPAIRRRDGVSKRAHSASALVATSEAAECERMYFVDLISPQVNLESDQVQGCIVLSPDRGYIQGLSFPQPKVSTADPHTRSRELLDIRLERTQLFAAPTTVDVEAGPMFVPADMLGHERPGPLLRRVCSRAPVRFAYEFWEGIPETDAQYARLGVSEEEIERLKQLHIMSLTIDTPLLLLKVNAAEKDTVIDVITTLVLERPQRQMDLEDQVETTLYTSQLQHDAAELIRERREARSTVKAEIIEFEALKLVLEERRITSADAERQARLASEIAEVDRALNLAKAEYALITSELRLMVESAAKRQARQAAKPEFATHLNIQRLQISMQDRTSQTIGVVRLAGLSGHSTSFEDDSGHYRYQLQDVHVFNALKDPYYQHTLQPWTKHPAWNPRDPCIRFTLRCSAPVGGIDIYDHFEVNLLPLQVELTQEYYKQLMAFWLGAEAAAAAATVDLDPRSLAPELWDGMKRGRRPHVSLDLSRLALSDRFKRVAAAGPASTAAPAPGTRGTSLFRRSAGIDVDSTSVRSSDDSDSDDDSRSDDDGGSDFVAVPLSLQARRPSSSKLNVPRLNVNLVNSATRVDSGALPDLPLEEMPRAVPRVQEPVGGSGGGHDRRLSLSLPPMDISPTASPAVSPRGSRTDLASLLSPRRVRGPEIDDGASASDVGGSSRGSIVDADALADRASSSQQPQHLSVSVAAAPVRKDSQASARLTRARSASGRSRAGSRKEARSDVQVMKERARQNQTFVYVRITDFALCASYKGGDKKRSQLEDFVNLTVDLRALSYHSQTWSWADLGTTLATDVVRQILAQSGRLVGSFLQKDAETTSARFDPGAPTSRVASFRSSAATASPRVSSAAVSGSGAAAARAAAAPARSTSSTPSSSVHATAASSSLTGHLAGLGKHDGGRSALGKLFRPRNNASEQDKVRMLIGSPGQSDAAPADAAGCSERPGSETGVSGDDTPDAASAAVEGGPGRRDEVKSIDDIHGDGDDDEGVVVVVQDAAVRQPVAAMDMFSLLAKPGGDEAVDE